MIADAPTASTRELIDGKIRWRRILPKTKLRADERRLFERELAGINNRQIIGAREEIRSCTHVRLNIYPDGGVSRLRVWGTIS